MHAAHGRSLRGSKIHLLGKHRAGQAAGGEGGYAVRKGLQRR